MVTRSDRPSTASERNWRDEGQLGRRTGPGPPSLAAVPSPGPDRVVRSSRSARRARGRARHNAVDGPDGVGPRVRGSGRPGREDRNGGDRKHGQGHRRMAKSSGQRQLDSLFRSATSRAQLTTTVIWPGPRTLRHRFRAIYSQALIELGQGVVAVGSRQGVFHHAER